MVENVQPFSFFFFFFVNVLKGSRSSLSLGRELTLPMALVCVQSGWGMSLTPGYAPARL
jgi:hypothetical protein